VVGKEFGREVRDESAVDDGLPRCGAGGEGREFAGDESDGAKKGRSRGGLNTGKYKGQVGGGVAAEVLDG
jgi:hypothetical protein